MRISYERTGGFGGLHLAAAIDVADLPADEAAQVRDLLERFDFSGLPGQLRSGAPSPDQFEHTITIETEASRHTVVTDGTAGPVELHELIRMMNRLARRQAGAR